MDRIQSSINIIVLKNQFDRVILTLFSKMQLKQVDQNKKQGGKSRHPDTHFSYFSIRRSTAQAVLANKTNEISATYNVELLLQTGDVTRNGAHAQMEIRRDLPVAIPLDQQAQYVQFAGR
jgi:hypothetical protein